MLTLSFKMERGVFIISLDFEMMWGNARWKPEGYGRTHVAHVRDVIGGLLNLFEDYGVCATFAVVGKIFLEETVDDDIPGAYKDLYYAPDVVRQLKASPWIEVGIHSYAHHPHVTKEMFADDLQKALETAKAEDICIKSMVFPNNYIKDEYLEECQKLGITCYRGNPVKFYDARSAKRAVINRICRLLDAYVNIGGKTSYRLGKKENGLMNVRASRFLRPYTPMLFFAEKLRLRRIQQEMAYAARHHEVYHLWWHPHNFGANMKKNFVFLEKILKTYKQLHQQYGMVSRTMGELAEKELVELTVDSNVNDNVKSF